MKIDESQICIPNYSDLFRSYLFEKDRLEHLDDLVYFHDAAIKTKKTPTLKIHMAHDTKDYSTNFLMKTLLVSHFSQRKHLRFFPAFNDSPTKNTLPKKNYLPHSTSFR